MQKITQETLLKAGVQHGHLAKSWNPEFRPFLFMKRDGRHVINIDKTLQELDRASLAMKELAETGKKILFIGSKKQAKKIIETVAKQTKQPYVTERWLGGALTNFATIKKLLRKMTVLDEQKEQPEYVHLTKKEKLIIERKKKKLNILLEGMASLKRLPGAIFAVDVNREATAIKEANKLKIPVFGIVDSNASARLIDYPIPGNDDSFEAIRVLVEHLGKAIEEGNAIWEVEKAKQKNTKEAAPPKEKEGIRKKRTLERVAQSEPVAAPKVTQENTTAPIATQAEVKREATKEEATPNVKAKSPNTSQKTAKTNAKEEEKVPAKQ